MSVVVCWCLTCVVCRLSFNVGDVLFVIYLLVLFVVWRMLFGVLCVYGVGCCSLCIVFYFLVVGVWLCAMCVGVCGMLPCLHIVCCLVFDMRVLLPVV